MPNHICNRLNVINPDTREKVIDYMYQKIPAGYSSLGIPYDEEESYMDFEKIVPMPDYIYQGMLGKEEDLYGKENCWYDWSLKHWGTKWNAYDSSADYDDIEFYTAWSGVPALMGILSQKFPDSEFDYKYADEDIGNNAGHYVFKNGSVLLANEYYCNQVGAYLMYRDTYGLYDYFIKVDRNCQGQLLYSPVRRV